ncbi:MAG: hypothetical protein HEP70_20115 [Rhodobiaceae bacterium]|nr:hypothetical protein [Rhodobiaceae bacterium]
MAKSNAVAQVTGELFEDGWSKVRGSMQGLGAKRKQMVRAARGGRSAVFKAIRSGGTHTKGQLANQLEYLTTKSSHIVDSRGVFDGKTQLSTDEIKSVVDRFAERWDKGFNRLCCTNRVRDSSCESSVVAGLHEQTDIPDLQDQELASLQ